jgi:dCMP deaminase
LVDEKDGASRRRLSKAQYYCEMLPMVARRSTCIRRDVAAIITDKEGHILSTGYNGVPSGIRHCYYNPCPGAQQKTGDSSLCEAVHAEQNAMIQCNDLRSAYAMYCSCTPCFTCAKMILNTPIKVIYCLERYPDNRAIEILLRRRISLYVAPDLVNAVKE